MRDEWEQDPEFIALITSISQPPLEAIAAFAKKVGVTQARDFWEVFDWVSKRRYVKRNMEGSYE